MKYRKFSLGISAVLVVASIMAIATVGFNLGVDFTGGSLWQLKIPNTTTDQVRAFFVSELNLEISNISFDESSQVYSMTLKEITDDKRQDYFESIGNSFDGAEDFDFWAVSPGVSKEVRNKAVMAVVLVLLGISLYVAIAFRHVSRPISSWKYGLIALMTLAHDVIIPAGIFAVLCKTMGAAVDTNFIIALLVVMGFSVDDTIVVFDRIRENLLNLNVDKLGLENIVNKSINETIARSINTSLTLIVILISLYLLGPVSLKYFILTILMGAVVGTYSSIFVASPLLVVSQKSQRNQ